MIKEIYPDQIKDKRAISFASEKLSAFIQENFKQNTKDNKLPLILSLNHNAKLKKKDDNSQNAQKLYYESPDYTLFERKKSIDLSTSFKSIIKNKENNNKKFHFIDENAVGKRSKTENSPDNDYYKYSGLDPNSKNKYLSCLSICNKNILDFKIKNPDKFQSASKLKSTSFSKKDNIFITNFENQNNEKTNNEKKFDLKNLMKNNKNFCFFENSGLCDFKIIENNFTIKPKTIRQIKEIKRKKNQVMLTIEQVREANKKNEFQRQNEKINYLMGFAESMNKIISDQRNKINFLLKNVSDKFEDVVKNS